MTSKKTNEEMTKSEKTSEAKVLEDNTLDNASGGFILEYTEYGGLKDVPKVAPKTKKPFDMGSGTV